MAVGRAGEKLQPAVHDGFQRGTRLDRPAWREFLEPENLTVIAILFWMSGPVAPLIPDLDSSLSTMMSLPSDSLSAPSGINDQILRLSWYPVYILVLLLAHRRLRHLWATAKQHWLLLLLLGWTLLSTLWSVSPADTLRRSMALSLTTTFALYLGARFDTLSAVKLVAFALGIDVLGSAVCAVAFPAIGVAHDPEHPGAWRGLFASKNLLGAMMLIECLAVCVLYFAERRRVYLVGLAGAFALLLLSTSKTPLFILLSLVPCLALVRRFFRTPRGFSVLLALALSVAAICFILGSATLSAILAFFDRDTTFTGRTDIWSLSWDAIQQRYWFGYGYGAFWASRWGPASSIWDTLNWRVPSSHSGLLELWLGLGLVGVIIFAVLLLRSLFEILSEAARGTCEECLWRFGYFILFVVHAITEPTAMDQTSIAWALLIAVATGRSRAGMAEPTRRTVPSVAAVNIRQASGADLQSGVATAIVNWRPATRPHPVAPQDRLVALAKARRLGPENGR
jgi:exopolysaccharide production protein ExoQ